MVSQLDPATREEQTNGHSYHHHRFCRWSGIGDPIMVDVLDLQQEQEEDLICSKNRKKKNNVEEDMGCDI